MHRTRLIAIALIAIIALINLYSLEQYPMPHADEGIDAEIANGFFERGRFNTELYGEQYGLDYNHVNSGRLFHIIEGAFLQLNLSLWMSRFYAYVGWLIALLACYLTGRELYQNEAVGLIAALAFASSIRALFASHFGPEMWVISLGLFSFYYMLITLKQPTPQRFLLLGLLAVPGLGFHPMGIWFAGAVSLIVLIEIIRLRRWRWLLMFGVGATISTGIYALVHLLPDPARTLGNLGGGSWYYADRNLLSGSPLGRVSTMLEFLSSTYFRHIGSIVIPFTLYAILAALILAFLRRREDRLLLTYTLVSLGAFAVGMQYRSIYYGVLWDAGLALCISAGLISLAAHIQPNLPAILNRLSPEHLALIAILPLTLSSMLAWGWFSYKFHTRDFAAYQAALHEHIPAGTRVMADTGLWWAFHDRNGYVSDWRFYDWIILDKLSFAEAIAANHIDYVVDDQTTVADDAASPESEALTAYLRASCDEVATIENRWFGRSGQIGAGAPTVIYRCTP